MPLPDGLPAITVTASFAAIDGSPAVGGHVIFDPGQRVEDATGGLIMEGPAVCPIDSTGVMKPAVLPYTDDTDLSPTGFSYTVTETVNGQPVTTYQIELPSTLGATVDLSTLAPATSPPEPTAFGTANTWTGTQTFAGNPPMIVPSGANGDVLTVDAEGNVTPQAPTGGDGGGSVDSVTAGDASMTVGGTGSSPTVETGRLDQIATLHPPTSAVAMNGQKHTGLGNGSASGDSVAYGQLGTAAFQPASAFDAAGSAGSAQTAAETYAASQASAAQSNAETFATSAVGTETARAEAAEALALPRTGGSLSGPATVVPVTLADAATVTLNAAASSTFKVTLGGNRTLASPASPVDGQTITVEVIQDGTGSRTLAYGAAYQFPASIGTPVLSATAGARDFLAFRYNADDTTWWCVGYVPAQALTTPSAVSQGGTGQASLTAYALLAGGTTTTGALQQVTGLGSAGWVLTSNGPAALPSFQAASAGGTYTAPTASVNYKSATPASSASLTAVMVGLGSTYTPGTTGIVEITLTGYAGTLTGVSTQTIGGRYGTGSAPANGVAATGNRWGSSSDTVNHTNGVATVVAFAFTDRLALTAGTTYWFDLVQATGNATDSVQLSNISMNIKELLA